jgi:hypothetical protein
METLGGAKDEAPSAGHVAVQDAQLDASRLGRSADGQQADGRGGDAGGDPDAKPELVALSKAVSID